MSSASQQLLQLTSAALALMLVGGCAVTQKQLYAVGGSRADGTVDMAYQVTELERPVVDMEQGRALAKDKCARWGYSDAEPFGGESRHCQALGGFSGCQTAQVVITYQCIGDLDAKTKETAAEK